MSAVRSLLVGHRGAAPRPSARPRRWTRWIGLSASAAFVVLVLVGAFFPTLLTGADPLAVDPTAALQAPSAQHVFGTDYVGRDLYTRVVYGSSLSLRGSLLAVLIALVAGSLIGLVSGYVGGFVDTFVMRVIDVILAIPGLLLSMTVVTALGFGTVNVAIAVGVASVAVFARLMRAEVYRVRGTRYIEAARLVGSSRLRILFRHLLPNSAGTVLTLAALEFGGAILAFSALSFLGYGAQPPQPEWGSLVNDGRGYLQTAWWLTTLPGLVIILTVLAANRISRALDPDQEAVR
ncbi:ABC transporter permease [Galbitalea sp. SE-J8]|uniref:ABC transporter permease n=1 Tax=Galbitalea sp. SE-J8 TaxID=3054952 RepID=UPI00259CA71C|nr:ABC transporter permease [Galbitalea sp. SE-J8]MDM4761586.1 ABC transporter permease [Galbitalea sp. SE-J8]